MGSGEQNPVFWEHRTRMVGEEAQGTQQGQMKIKGRGTPRGEGWVAGSMGGFRRTRPLRLLGLHCRTGW